MAQTGKEAYEALAHLIVGLKEDVEKFYDKEVNAAGGRLRKFWKQVGEISRAEKKNILEVRSNRTKI
jgi:hypothetical protein